MRNRRLLYVLGLTIVIAVAAVWLFSQTAVASLGNTGTPVYGRLSGPVPQSDEFYVKFYTVDGPTFGDGNQTVPDGKYLIITDILLTPDGGSDLSGLVSVDLNAGGVKTLRLRSTDNATLNIHYTMPYFILEAGESLSVTNAWFSDNWAYVNVSGVLVNHVTYLPLAVGD